MVYVEYFCGQYRTEIKNLLRKRILLKDKLRKSRLKSEQLENELKNTEAELERFFSLAKGKSPSANL